MTDLRYPDEYEEDQANRWSWRKRVYACACCGIIDTLGPDAMPSIWCRSCEDHVSLTENGVFYWPWHNVVEYPFVDGRWHQPFESDSIYPFAADCPVRHAWEHSQPYGWELGLTEADA